MDYAEMEMNGCYAMLCSGLRVWNGIHGRATHAKAALALKSIYTMEYHRAGDGCPWRDASWDEKDARDLMASIGLDRKGDLDRAGRIMSALLDGDPGPYVDVSDRQPEDWVEAHGSFEDRFGAVEQYHNALRRITRADMWDTLLDRRVMDENLDAISRLAAHAVRIERWTGREPVLEPLFALCHRDRRHA